MIQGGFSASKAIKGTEDQGTEVAHLRFCADPGVSLD